MHRGRLAGATKGLSTDLKLDLLGFCHPAGSVEDFHRDEIALGVVVEDYAGLVLIALGDRGIFIENESS